MRLTYAHLADFASIGSDGKLTVVGAFDALTVAAPAGPLPFPACYLVAGFEASISEGSDHRLEVSLVTDDEAPVALRLDGALTFRTSGVGHPAWSRALVGFGAGAVRVPEQGDYHFRFVVDGEELGKLRVTVRRAKASV